MKVATYNINFSRRAKGENEKYSIKYRIDGIIKSLKENDIILIQELHDSQLNHFTTKMGEYEWYFGKQNSRNRVCNIGIGIIKGKYSSLTFNEENFNKYLDGNENVITCYIKDIDTLICNIHFPCGLKYRKSMVEYFPTMLSKYGYNKLIIGGDFNSYPDIWGYEQMLKMNSLCGTYSGSEYCLKNGVICKKSFKGYPYDLVPESDKLFGKIDHFLIKGYGTTKCTAHENYCEKLGMNLSDHFLIKIELNENLNQIYYII